MHEYMTSIEVKNLPENLAKTDDISKMLKSLGGPLPQVSFCPTGGVSPSNAGDYLSLSNVICVGGSWISPDAEVAAGDWAAIEARARQARTLK